MKISDILSTGSKRKTTRGPRATRIVQTAFHINEGGAMPGVGSIHHSEIEPTLAQLEKELGVPLLANALGSVGKKEFSGDIDIAVQLDKEQLADFAKKLDSSSLIQDIKKSSVFMTVVDIVDYDETKTAPGLTRTGKVQIDFMPGDVDFMKNYYFSPSSKEMSQDGRSSKYKGVHRNIMIASIAAALPTRKSEETTEDGRPMELERWMYSPSDGMVRVVRKPVAKKDGSGYTKQNSNTIVKGPYKKPEDWAKILKLDSAKDLYSFETLYAAVKKNYPADVAKQIFDQVASNPSIIAKGVPTELTETARKKSDVHTLYNLGLTEDARIQHVEDLAIWNGSAGINKAIGTLHGLENDPSNITVKWDGSPAVIFGRDEEGNFILTDKSGFGAKGYNGRAKSADELETMLKNRPGYANNPDGYGPFIEKMKTVYGTFEAATPESFEGYVLGDLLYFSTPSVVEGAYEFTPNIVTYRVKTDSDIGSQIAASDAGVVLHAHMDFEGNKSKVDVSKLNAGKLLIMPPVTVTQAPKVEADNLNKLEAFAKSNASKIDTLLDDSYLKANKLSGFKNALYSYVNNMTKARKLDNLDKDYAGWLDTAKLSAPMKERMLAHVEANMEGMQALFKIITGIMSVKNDIIAQLDASDADVEAYTDGQRGGEGYVIGQGDSKLVNRSGFSAANMGRER